MTNAVRRYVRSYDEPDDYTCDCIWKDRLTGDVVLRYDVGDPANTSAAYGAPSDQERFARRDLDIHEEIDADLSVLPVARSQVASVRTAKEARAQRELEEREARGLEDFLGAEFDRFDFADYGRGERDILRPALEARGFTSVAFYMVEEDSFGPLIRGAVACDPEGKRVRFFYG